MAITGQVTYPNLSCLRAQVVGAIRCTKGSQSFLRALKGAHPLHLIPISCGFLICCRSNSPAVSGSVGHSGVGIGRVGMMNAGA